jgi:hypothetical protein
MKNLRTLRVGALAPTSPGLVLGLGTTVELACAFALEKGRVSHAHVWLLVVECAVLLPALVHFVRAARVAPPSRRIERAASFALLAVLAVGSLALSTAWARGILWGDESAYRFTAETFASGRLALPAPPPTSADAALAAAELRFTHHIVHAGQWFTKYPPLWPAVLALGYLAHAPWAVNPALGALTLVVLWKIAKHELTIAEPALVVVLVVGSPFFFLMTASSMSHALSALLLVTATWMLLRGLRTQRLAPLSAAALLGCACAFVRPFTALSMGLAAGPFTLVMLARARRIRLLVEVSAVALALGAATVAGMMLYNVHYTGSPTLSPYALYRGTAVPVELSFHVSTVVANLKTTARWSIEETLAFSYPFLGLFALYALARDRAHRAIDVFLFGTIALFWIANLVQPEGSSSRFGDRYVYEAWFGVALLAARGVCDLAARYRVPRGVSFVAIGATTLVALVQGRLLAEPVLAEMAPYAAVHAFVERLPIRDAVVFFTVSPAFTGDRFNLNGPGYRDAPKLYLVDPGPARRAAVAESQGRSRWVVVTFDAAARTPRILDRGEVAR